MSIKYYIYSVIISSLTLSGCTKFLEVTPRSTVSDDKLFEDEPGFQQALNGVYNEMSGRSLYGDNLSMGYLSALAKNYTMTQSSHRFYLTNTFDYKNSSSVESVWNKSYTAIATLNNVLNQMENRKELFKENNYSLIKGEALALRAYLHFDLLRLFGQNYQSNPSAKAIPYRTVYDLNVKEAQTSQEVIEMTLRDLDEAEELLATTDPIVVNKDLYRRYRINYYAVLGLKARVYNYINDGVQASEYADKVIASDLFPFVEKSAITTKDVKRKDRLFSSELVFSLRAKDIGKWADGSVDKKNDVYFHYTISGASNYTLTMPDANYRSLFEVPANPDTDPVDYRYAHLIEREDILANEVYPSKYWQTWEPGSGEISRDRKDQTIPLIRISEMYYILAKNATSIDKALGYLNIVRQNRGIVKDLTTSNIVHEGLLLDEITKEYQKEFYAEGQTFFWYKQIGATSIKFYAGTVVPENYVFPIPITEQEYNPSYNNK
ncbi:RagB/SusD family nutrient uptake outer membrane protein [Sphingobacterium paucimobilis]|uniref:SusD-like N-terminal domain-containing protein n=1 Tax=Sphingobacterium paucimobilis HER1398 TaxID=1346330 RepID=U2IYY9_9SPHI|nr:RagB/SusD family nutrient uptake outer membrane protein [Sphingobacterium paucimobilis]ERJ57919.1 hypothetical protein M472_03980 [Sphingobacterium paucimobilis HER1398]